MTNPMLTHVCRISGHPLSTQPRALRKHYLKGLGVVLHKISNGHANMRMFYSQWAYSIEGKDVSEWFQSADETLILKVLRLNCRGLRFFRVKHQFYFDCYYLTETFNLSVNFNPNLLDSLYSYLQEKGCTRFTKKSLELTHFVYFHSGYLKIEPVLSWHRINNLNFYNLPVKRFLVVATVSAGKSTLINALTGHYFNRVKTGVCTSRICTVSNKPLPDGITLCHNGILSYSPDIALHSSDDVSEVAFHFESSLGEHAITLIDTPGVNNSKSKDHMRITAEAIKQMDYDALIFVLNSQYNGTDDERKLLEFVHTSCNKPIFFVLNQLDRFKNGVDNISKMINDCHRELGEIGFKAPNIYPMSAQYALLLRTEAELDEDDQYDLEMLRRRFGKSYYDMQRYRGKTSETELEKSGIAALEQNMVNI